MLYETHIAKTYALAVAVFVTDFDVQCLYCGAVAGGADTLSEAENRLSMLQSQYNTAKEQREEANATYQAALREYRGKRTN